VTHRQQTGETLLGGCGEMHLRVAVERLTGKYGLKVDTKRALVPYRETIRVAVTKPGASSCTASNLRSFSHTSLAERGERNSLRTVAMVRIPSR
jgi:elongation factor G